jgi:hypothetical protein
MILHVLRAKYIRRVVARSLGINAPGFVDVGLGRNHLALAVEDIGNIDTFGLRHMLCTHLANIDKLFGYAPREYLDNPNFWRERVHTT